MSASKIDLNAFVSDGFNRCDLRSVGQVSSCDRRMTVNSGTVKLLDPESRRRVVLLVSEENGLQKDLSARSLRSLRLCGAYRA